MLSSRDSAVVSMAVEQVRSGIESLTPAAKHVYELAARQVVVEAVFALCCAYDTVVTLGNPEWAAISKLAEMVKGGTR